MTHHATILAALLLLLLPAAACDGCFSKVPPQPADGRYTISAELPDVDCFWMFLAELQPHEELGSALERAYSEKHVQTHKKFEREWRRVEEADGRWHWERRPDVPEVEVRGLVLRNPAAPHEWRDVIIPSYRDNMMDFAGSREVYYNLFLSIRLGKDGITARTGEGSCQLARAEGPPRFWPWSDAESFLAELPGMIMADPKKVAPRQVIESLSQPMRDRIRSGRRMVTLTTAKGLPIAPHWECLAKLAAIVGGQNLAFYNGEIVFAGAEYERRERRLMGYPESPDPRPRMTPPCLPEVEVEPVIDWPVDE